MNSGLGQVVAFIFLQVRLYKAGTLPVLERSFLLSITAHAHIHNEIRSNKKRNSRERRRRESNPLSRSPPRTFRGDFLLEAS